MDIGKHTHMDTIVDAYLGTQMHNCIPSTNVHTLHQHSAYTLKSTNTIYMGTMYALKYTHIYLNAAF